VQLTPSVLPDVEFREVSAEAWFDDRENDTFYVEYVPELLKERSGEGQLSGKWLTVHHTAWSRA